MFKALLVVQIATFSACFFVPCKRMLTTVSGDKTHSAEETTKLDGKEEKASGIKR